MIQEQEAGIVVSALIASRHQNGVREFLNVRAHNKDSYGFPGGKLEYGETPEAAVIRETEEEIGVTPTNIRYLDVFKSQTPEGRSMQMYVFSGDITGSIAPHREIAELHWLSYAQMIEQSNMLTPMTKTHILPMLKQMQ